MYGELNQYGRANLLRRISKGLRILNRKGYILVNCSEGLIKDLQKRKLLD